MAKDNINQELTRQNIVELRKDHGYTQSKVAELMGGSRTIYNGIENGKVKITEYYVQTLAEVYGVPFESIAVFASGYDEGFYQGMQTRQKLDESQFISESMKVYHAERELLTRKKYKSALNPALRAMGYSIEVLDIADIDTATVPKDVVEKATDGKVFAILKNFKTLGYIAPNDFYAFEHFLNTAINGYLDEVKENFKKAGNTVYKSMPKSHSKAKRSRLPKTPKNMSKGYRLASHNDKKSAEKQMKQLQENIRTHGIKVTDDDEVNE